MLAASSLLSKWDSSLSAAEGLDCRETNRYYRNYCTLKSIISTSSASFFNVKILLFIINCYLLYAVYHEKPHLCNIVHSYYMKLFYDRFAYFFKQNLQVIVFVLHKILILDINEKQHLVLKDSELTATR